MNKGLRSAAKSLVFLLPLRWSRAIRFRVHASHWPSLRDPRGVNEKINWRILNDRRDIWDWTCDKLEAKLHAERLSPGILIPEVLWFGDDVTELDSLDIDGRWILKPNGSSQSLLVGEGAPDVAELRRKVRRWKTDFQWRINGEMAYANARRLLVLERWIGDGPEVPTDYKIFVYDGVVKYIHAHTGRFVSHRSSVYTPDWSWLEDVRQDHIKPHDAPIAPPPHLEELVRRASDLGAGFDFVRVDLYDTEEGVWFGEMTPYAWSGMRPYRPEWFELEAGSHWTLPDVK